MQLRFRRAVAPFVAATFLAMSGSAAAAPGGDATIEATPFNAGVNELVTTVTMCPAGERATGGGFHPLDPTVGNDYDDYRLSFSNPVDSTGTTAGTDDGEIPRGWSVSVVNINAPQAFRAYAICSATSDATVEELSVAVGGGVTERMIACPASSRAVGGGVGTTTALDTDTMYPFSYRSVPVGPAETVAGTASGDVPRGWLSNASIQPSTASPPFTFRFYAVCSATSDATVQVAPFTVFDDDTVFGVNGDAAACPSGRRALSGGAASDLESVEARIERNGPFDATGTPTGTDDGDVARSWYGAERFVSGGGPETEDFRTMAVCAADDIPLPPPDTTPPETTITDVKVKSKKRKATFAFASSEQGSAFACKVDKGEFASCESPKPYKKLKRGKHKFKVAATDAAGNADTTPAVAKFKIKK